MGYKTLKQVLFGIFILSLGVFPAMPVMHAEESMETMDHHHNESTDCCNDCTDTQEHDMQDCIDAVQDVLGYSNSVTLISPDTEGAILPFWREQSYGIEKIHEMRFSRSQDPPYFSSHTLVGIIKLTI